MGAFLVVVDVVDGIAADVAGDVVDGAGAEEGRDENAGSSIIPGGKSGSGSDGIEGPVFFFFARPNGGGGGPDPKRGGGGGGPPDPLESSPNIGGGGGGGGDVAAIAARTSGIRSILELSKLATAVGTTEVLKDLFRPDPALLAPFDGLISAFDFFIGSSAIASSASSSSRGLFTFFPETCGSLCSGSSCFVCLGVIESYKKKLIKKCIFFKIKK